MYTIYKYEWGAKNRLGSQHAEIVYPTNKESTAFVCAFVTDAGIDLRRLREDALVDEYTCPLTQRTATVFKSKIPFFSLISVRRRIRRAAIHAAFDRLIAAFYGHKLRRDTVIDDLLREFAWTPSQRVTTILM